MKINFARLSVLLCLAAVAIGCWEDHPDGCSNLYIGRWENTFTSSCNKHDMCYICVSICLFNSILAFKLFRLSLQTPRHNLVCYYVLNLIVLRFCSHFTWLKTQPANNYFFAEVQLGRILIKSFVKVLQNQHRNINLLVAKGDPLQCR